MLPSSDRLSFRLLHRELVLLAVLIALAAAAFAGTRAFAQQSMQLRRADAARWYRRGRARLDAGDTRGAVDALKRAARMHPTERDYSLRLATALAEDGQDAAATQLLTGLREGSPEDPDVNLQLAHLEAKRGNIDAAARYYHGALDALWRPEQTEQRRSVRLELIRFLLAQHDISRALSETLGLTPDLAEDAGSQIEAGELFLASGDPVRAFARFTAALQRQPDSDAALAGAGRAAFERGDFIAARRYLARAHDTSPAVEDARRTTALVLERDPLAARLSRRDREARLGALLTYAAGRLDHCAGRVPNAPVDQLRSGIADFQRRLGDRLPLDRDALENATALAVRVARDIGGGCAPLSPLDRALVLIGRVHGLDETPS